jgi:hypothetical protein
MKEFDDLPALRTLQKMLLKNRAPDLFSSGGHGEFCVG